MAVDFTIDRTNYKSIFSYAAKILRSQPVTCHIHEYQRPVNTIGGGSIF